MGNVLSNCPNGTPFSSIKLNDPANTCISCPAGQYVNNGVCTNCQSGTWSTTTNATSCTAISCTAAGYTGTSGACKCASGYSGTVTYTGGVLGGCAAIPCTTLGYTGTAGSCTCASGYSGTVTYTGGVLGGCISLFSVSKKDISNTSREYAITITQSANTTAIYTLDDVIPYTTFYVGNRTATIPAGCSSNNLTFDFYGDTTSILLETIQYIGSGTRGSSLKYKKLTLKVTTNTCNLNNYTGYTFIIFYRV